jgi:ParB/RepB/Spo0J family partition protein
MQSLTLTPVPNVAGMSGAGPDDMNRRARDIRTIPLATIDMDEGARLRPLDPAKVAELAASIKTHGLLQPIGVQIVKSGRFTSRYRLIYGAHRLAAAILLNEENPRHEVIACMIYPANMPAAAIQMDEIVENLHRKELTPAERAGHTTRYAGLLKKAGLVASADHNRASKQRVSTHGTHVPAANRSKGDSVQGQDTILTKPTVTEKLSKELGVHRHAIQNRVILATKLAARQGVVPKHKTIEAMTADELMAVGDAAVQEGQRKREKAQATGKADRSTDPIWALKPTESTVRLDVDDLPNKLEAWVRRRCNDANKRLALDVLKATRARLDAIIAEIEATGACRPAKGASE